MSVATGDTVRLEFTVTEADTSVALGSGDVPVLATPRLVAWFEAATVTAISASLAVGSTSVGTHVTVDHVAASAVGAVVEVNARVVGVDGRSVEFEVTAHDADRLVGSGTVRRVVVDRDRFLRRLG